MFLQTIENVSCKSRIKNVKKIKFSFKVRLIFIIPKNSFLQYPLIFFMEKTRKQNHARQNGNNRNEHSRKTIIYQFSI